MLLDIPMTDDMIKNARGYAGVHTNGSVAQWVADLVLQATDINEFNMKMGDWDEVPGQEADRSQAGERVGGQEEKKEK